MSSGGPDISMLSRLLRSRLASGFKPLSSRPRNHAASHGQSSDERSSAVIGSLLRDAREAYANNPAGASSAGPGSAATASTASNSASPATLAAGTIQSAADTRAQMSNSAADPGDLSAFVLETLNSIDWDEWVTARCDFPQSGPFGASGTSAALEALASILDALFDDACNDGDDLTVSIQTAHEGGSVRLTVTGPFTLSLNTLGLIKRHRIILESSGGALYTVRNLGTAGFEALIPAR